MLREGDKIQKLETGDFVLVPHGHGHAVLDNSTSPVAQLDARSLSFDLTTRQRQVGGFCITETSEPTGL